MALSGLWEDESESLLEELLEIAENDTAPDVRAAALGLLGNAILRSQEATPNPPCSDESDRSCWAFRRTNHAPRLSGEGQSKQSVLLSSPTKHDPPSSMHSSTVIRPWRQERFSRWADRRKTGGGRLSAPC